MGVTYLAQRSIKADTTENFWMQGGSIELGADVWKGLGFGLNISGSHAGFIGSSNVPLSLQTITVGPRYRWHSGHKVSLYGEAMIGTANGFNSLFPTQFGSDRSANSSALQVGGGVDYRLSHHFSARLLDAAWLRTQLPNSTNNVQNTLGLGSGIVLRFGH